MIRKRYFKTNKQVLDFINKRTNDIIHIRPIKRENKRKCFISSYCVYYKNMIK